MFVKLVFSIPVNNYFYYSVPVELSGGVEIGRRVKVNFNNRDTYGYVIETTNKISGQADLKNIKPILDVLDDGPVFNRQVLKLALWISSYYFSSLGEVLKIMTPGSFTPREYLFEKDWRENKKVQLTAKQQEIVNKLCELDPPDYALVYGITGSGKTEIYLSLMEHYIKKKSRSFISYPRYLLPNS